MFTCCVCLTFEDNLFPITDYAAEFTLLTGLRAEPEALLCPKCIRRLTEAVAFRNDAIKADEILKTCPQLDSLLVKDEPFEEVSEEFPEALLVPEEPQESPTKAVTKNLAKSCPYCFFYSRDKTVMRSHVQNHIESSGGLQCDHCGQKYPRKSLLRAHFRRLLGGQRDRSSQGLRCYVCKEVMPSRSSLETHLQEVHQEKPKFMCQICGRTYHKKSGLMQHTKVHGSGRKFECGSCSKTFSCVSYLKMHENRHLIGRPFVCAACGKSFAQKVNLLEHETTHNPEKTLRCETCGALFKTVRLLKSHNLTHSDEYKFTCSKCGMNFKRKSNLTEHLISHSETRNFKCAKCGIQFKAKPSLRRHMKKHEEERFLERSVVSEFVAIQNVVLVQDVRHLEFFQSPTQ